MGALPRCQREGCAFMNVLFWWFAITIAAVGFILLGLGVAKGKGKQDDATTTTASSKSNVCPGCGYVLRSTADFCGHCGHQINRPDA